jgi:hypothetical protein
MLLYNASEGLRSTFDEARLMSRSIVLSVFVAASLGLLASDTASGQSVERYPSNRTIDAVFPSTHSYVIEVWFNRDNKAGTFKARVFDLSTPRDYDRRAWEDYRMKVNAPGSRWVSRKVELTTRTEHDILSLTERQQIAARIDEEYRRTELPFETQQVPYQDVKPHPSEQPKTKTKATTFSYNNHASKDEIFAADIHYRDNDTYAFSMYGKDQFGAMIAAIRDVTDFDTYAQKITYRKTSVKREQQMLQAWSSRIDSSIAEVKNWEQAYQPIREKNTKAYEWTENWRADFNQRFNQHSRNQDYALSLRRVSEDTGSFFDEGKYHYEDSSGKRYTRNAYKNIVTQRLADSDRLKQERVALQQRLNSDARIMEQYAALEKEKQEQLDQATFDKRIYNLGYKSLMNAIASHE